MTKAFDKSKLPWGAIRTVTILLAAAALVYLAYPLANGFVDEAHSSEIASAGRVLQRGAQIAATQRLISGDNFTAAADYLSTEEGFQKSLEAAKYPVKASKIIDAALDEKGLLTEFACVIEYNESRYIVDFDISEHSGTVTYLEAVTQSTEK